MKIPVYSKKRIKSKISFRVKESFTVYNMVWNFTVWKVILIALLKRVMPTVYLVNEFFKGIPLHESQSS